MSTPFRTLCREVEISGIGLHSGAAVTARLMPRAEKGIVFARADLPQSPEIPASAGSIGSTHHATTLFSGEVAVSTPEHLLAALWGLGISHCRIEMEGPEVPILDGSALLWCEAIHHAGIEELDGARPEYSLREPVLIASREGAVVGLPHSSLRVTLDVDYGLKYLAPQIFACDVTPQNFVKEIAAARTFTLESWIEPLRALNLIQGGSPDNAIVLSSEKSSSPLRVGTELARHKALDLLGDVSLLFGKTGGVLRAHLIAVRAGHELHRQWMEEVLRRNALQAH